MPSVSPKQAGLMAKAANDAAFAKRKGIKQSVAQEFHSADKSQARAGRGALLANNKKRSRLQEVTTAG